MTREICTLSPIKLLVLMVMSISVILGITTSALAVEYKYTELLPPGHDLAGARGINNSGAVVGYVATGYGTAGFLYSAGVYTYLIPPGVGGMNGADAYCINDSGAVVGIGYDIDDYPNPFLYSAGVYTYLIPPGASRANAYGINNSGAVVGGATISKKGKGFLYSAGVYTYLIPPGWSGAEAYGINDSGAVVGWGYDVTGITKGFLYSAGVYTTLLPPGWSKATAYGINNSGAVVGYGVDGTGIQKVFLYSAGVYTELLPPGWSSAYAGGINDSGTVVGYGVDGTGIQKVFLYSAGVYTELLPPGWSWAYAHGINNSGAVVGLGLDGTGTYKGFIAEPTPTLISLSEFKAIPGDTAVTLKWVTESEVDNAGFNLYRSESEDGEYEQMNNSLIPAKGSSTQGASYEFIDTDVQNRKTYYYKLEDIDLNGTSTMHGPVSATPRWVYAIGK